MWSVDEWMEDEEGGDAAAIYSVVLVVSASFSAELKAACLHACGWLLQREG